jgi:predicted metal-dependent hydrolase
MAIVPRLPHAFLDGVRRFNAGQFFEAHEAFEELLGAVETDGRWELLVALIQVAVGYHKCASNHLGGRVMLEKGLAKLAPFADDAGGVAIGALRARLASDVATLAAGAPSTRVVAVPPRIALAPGGNWSTDS